MAMRLGKSWLRRQPGNKRHARRCCPNCAARLVDERKPDAKRPAWRCPACGPIKKGGYASGLEADRAMQLRALEKAGVITGLKEQRVFEVQPPGCERIAWRVDYTYTEGGIRIAEDAKGIEDGEYRIKAKLFRWRYAGQIELRISRRGRQGRIYVERAA